MGEPAKIQVVDPLVSVQHNKHHVEQIFLLPEARHWFSMPLPIKPNTERKRFGPALIVINRIGTKCDVKVFRVNDARPWKRISSLMQVGAWALSNRFVARFLPEQFLAQSQRFADATKEQRVRMAK